MLGMVVSRISRSCASINKLEAIFQLNTNSNNTTSTSEAYPDWPPGNATGCVHNLPTYQQSGVDSRQPVGTAAFHITVLSVMMVLIIIGSSLMILTITTHAHLRSVTNIFVIALSVSDIITGLVVIPINLAFPTALFYGYTTCIYAACITMVVCLSSIASIMAVAVDR